MLSCKYKLLWSSYTYKHTHTHTHTHKREIFEIFVFCEEPSRLLSSRTLLYSPLCITQFKGFPICSSLMIPTNKKPAKMVKLLAFIFKNLCLAFHQKSLPYSPMHLMKFFETTHHNLAIQNKLLAQIVSGFLP